MVTSPGSVMGLSLVMGLSRVGICAAVVSKTKQTIPELNATMPIDEDRSHFRGRSREAAETISDPFRRWRRECVARAVSVSIVLWRRNGRRPDPRAP